MSKLKIIAAYAVAALVLVAALWVGYEQLVFVKHKAEIDLVLAEASTGELDPPALVVAVLAGDADAYAATNFWVSGHFLLRSYPTKMDAPTVQQLDRFLWSRLLRRHYSRGQIVALYCALAPVGDDVGLEAVSRRLFDAPPRALRDDQLAYVLAALRAPTWVESDPERLRQLAERLLRDAQTSSSAPVSP
ncbi:MAG: transglycosylase domain-containing protein [Acidobacteriota bacterium]